MVINKINQSVFLLTMCLLSACIPPVCSTRHVARFKNCTNDTVYIGGAFYDNIDSLYDQLSPGYNIKANSGLDTTGISLWKEIYFSSDEFVYPDSMCLMNADVLFFNTDIDTCYFFLIKMKDAKKFSWDEIRAKKLYHKSIVTRKKDGEFGMDIR